MNGLDPLETYTREALIDLVSQQAAILEETQAKAEHFERLYLDIVHSTSWRLAWPIRAAIKLLSWLRQKIQGRGSPATAKNSRAVRTVRKTPDDAATDAARDFSGRLSALAYFKSPSTEERLNVLITCRHDHETLQALLQTAAIDAVQRHVDLRILALDPELTARDCLDRLRDPAAFGNKALPTIQFHRVEPINGPRNHFRVDFGSSDYMITDSPAGLAFAKGILPEAQCSLVLSHTVETRRGEGLA